jgi:hypothetical protein
MQGDDVSDQWCPHCGGQSGYITNQRRQVSRLYSWNGDAEDVDNERVLSETLPRCFDCNKIVRLPPAQPNLDEPPAC